GMQSEHVESAKVDVGRTCGPRIAQRTVINVDADDPISMPAQCDRMPADAAAHIQHIAKPRLRELPTQQVHFARGLIWIDGSAELLEPAPRIRVLHHNSYRRTTR